MGEPVLAIRPELVSETLDQLGKRVFSPVELREIVRENRDEWLADQERPGYWIVKSRNIRDVVAALTAHGLLSRIALPFPHREVQRFTYGEVPSLEILQSVDRRAYFCHYTAIHIHGLTTQIPKTVYLNVEQPGSGGTAQLTQEGIDRAFRGKCRVSSNEIEFRGQRVVKLNGRNTGELGVVQFSPDDEGSPLRVTNIERTLIDATVRPVYAGGVAQVAEAFRAAAGRLSVNRTAAYLRKLRFTYPYHQSIGFYLERAGTYSASQVELLREFPMEFDFYLTYQMREADYNKRWRLYVPKGFQ
ncbi:MAG TPA: hypothetical protein VMY37_23110 [Thermoguttaceae bacterium]|nr:hypothetical protein [Thermoguttaceae bacterium]